MTAHILAYTLMILFAYIGTHGLFSFTRAGGDERKFSGFGFLVPVGFLFAAWGCARLAGV